MSLFKEKVELKIEEAEFKAGQTLLGFPVWQKRVLIFCLAAVIPGYFISRAIGSSYYEKNYKRDLISAHPSFSDPKKLVVDRLDIAVLAENEFSVAAQVVNSNLDLAAKDISYEFKFLTAEGVEAAAPAKGKFYILPNQRKHLIIPSVASNAGIAGVQLVLDENVRWQKKLELPEVKILTSLPKGEDRSNPFGYVLEGSFTNTSAYNIKEVKLTFMLYGAGGKAIGASQRSEFDVKPFEKRDYTQIWAGISGRNVVRAETYAETNLLDKENLTAPDLPTGGGAGSLGR